jgi:hypothetical protein
VESTVSQDRLAAVKAKLDQPRAETYKFTQEGDEIAGTVVRLEVASTDYGTHKIVVIDPGDGNLRSIWLLHDALHSQFMKLKPQPGDVIAIRYLGRQQAAASGRSYHAYTVTSDREQPQFQWDAAVAASPAAASSEDYEFDDGTPLPPAPDDPWLSDTPSF